MITIKELSIDTEIADKIINLIKKHEPEIWKVLKEELKQALNIPDVVVPKGTLCEPHGCINYSQGYDRCDDQCKKCEDL